MERVTEENGWRGSRIGVSKAWATLLLLSTSPILGGAIAQTPVNATSGQPTSQLTTLKAMVRRVNVDVVVTDWNGKPVSGLTKDDFRVEEDKVPQSVRSFDVYSTSARHAEASPATTSLPPNTFLTVPKSREAGTPAIILFDALNNVFAEYEFLKFLGHRGAGNPLAVYVLGDRLYLLKGFDEEIAVSEAKKLLLRYGLAARANRSGFYSAAENSLHALAEIGRAVTSMPGRKNLIWYSYGFPESLLPGPLMAITINKGNPRPPSIRAGLQESFLPNYAERIRKVTDLLALDRVAVYPVDVRGVVAYQIPSFSYGVLNLQALQFSSMINNSVEATMDTVADDTGGHAFYGSNDLEGSLEQATLSGSTYYALTYEPTNPKYDGSLRHIKVTLRQSGYDLSYRKVYYADDLSGAARTASETRRELIQALERATPLAQDLFIVAHVAAVGPLTAATSQQMQMRSEFQPVPDRYAKKQKKAPESGVPLMMQQYLISYALVARQLDMPIGATGEHRASLELGAVAYDEDGRMISGIESHEDDTLSADRYAGVVADGYRVQQTISVPVTATTLRLAVRDVTANRTGSLEIPLPLAKVAQATTAAFGTAAK